MKVLGNSKCYQQTRIYLKMNQTIFRIKSVAIVLIIVLYLICNAIALDDNSIPIEEKYHDDEIDLRKQPIFLNEFAAYIPNGIDAAHRVAENHGCEFSGQVCVYYYYIYYTVTYKQRFNVAHFLQIGSLKNYFLFRCHHISKRSININEEHHDKLKYEPEVN